MAQSIIRFHPAVRAAIDILNTDLPELQSGVKVGDTYPPNADPALFVRVERVGGQTVNLVTDNAMLVFECWAKRGPGTPNAEALAMDVSAVLHHSQSGTYLDEVFVRWWNSLSIVRNDDPDKPTMSRWDVAGELGLSPKR